MVVVLVGLGKGWARVQPAGWIRLRRRASTAAVHGIVVLGLEGKLGPSSRPETAARVELVVRAALAGFGAEAGLVPAVNVGAEGEGAGG